MKDLWLHFFDLGFLSEHLISNYVFLFDKKHILYKSNSVNMTTIVSNYQIKIKVNTAYVRTIYLQCITFRLYLNISA